MAADEPEILTATPSNTPIREKKPTAYVPNLSRLNLAYLYPEGSDTSNVRESYAGKAFETLMNMDEDWYSNLFIYGDFLPETVAAQLGISKSAVMGGYNPADEYHQADNPETWVIHSFKRIHTSFVNGDGAPVGGASNVIPIMSMANVYMFYQDPSDYDSYIAYAKSLWNASHSYSIRLGNVYYCSGCIGKDAETAELEALREEAKLEESGAAAASAVGESVGSSVVSYDSVSEAAYENPETSVTIYTQKDRDNHLDGPGTAVLSTPSDAEMAADTSSESAEAVSSSALPEMPQEAIQAADGTIAAAEGQASVPDASSSVDSVHRNCPGHVDLYITATVRGLDDKRGLYEADAVGSQTPEEGSRWDGWNPINRGYVSALSNLDWYEQYGLSVSMISLRTPLTVSEIEEYLEALPDSVSAERRQLVEFALSSVGQVPYYWGGKPRTAGYKGNNFGSVTVPDEDGRILRGLDCSGWINWVYWSVFGKRLSYESTSGLATLGKRVNRSQLQPGDIVIRTGSQAHVIMFLGWTEDGQIQCIEETSGTANNVRLSVREAYWPYYRNLID